MNEYGVRARASIPKSLVALVVAFVVFMAVWVVGLFLFTLLDQARGLGDNKLQAVFREVVVPGIGGFLAMAAPSWIQGASHRFVFFGFAATVLIVIGVYLGFVGPIAGKVGLNVWDILWSVSTLAAAIIGAYLALKDELR